MNDTDLIKALAPNGNTRATIYLNDDQVSKHYLQSVGVISQLARTKSLASKISGGLAGFFSGGVEGERALSASIEITPLMKAMLVEYQSSDAKELVDLSTTEPTQGKLHRFIGDSHLCGFDDEVSPATTKLSDTLSATISRERDRQAKILRQKDATIKTVVWSSLVQGRALASIASSHWVDMSNLCSYSNPPLGILCRYEKKIDEVTFLSPIWIWHDGW